jgi:hypothetical protein
MGSQKDVDTFVEAARSFVQRTLGVELDRSEESLAFVDHYAKSARDSQLKDELLALVAPALGAYLGEVAIAKFGGAWVLEGEDPSEWRVELTPVPLRFWPVGMAAEALRGDEVEGYDASFTVFGPSASALTAELREQLARVPPVETDYFYSLTGRLETLTHAVDVLTTLVANAKERANAPTPDDDEDEN